MSGYEARKLQDDVRQELHAAPVVAVGAAPMLLLIIGLAWGGASSEAPANGYLPSRARLEMSVPESYSQTVFEARRQRYIEAYPDSFVARDAILKGKENQGWLAIREGSLEQRVRDHPTLMSPRK